MRRPLPFRDERGSSPVEFLLVGGGIRDDASLEAAFVPEGVGLEPTATSSDGLV